MKENLLFKKRTLHNINNSLTPYKNIIDYSKFPLFSLLIDKDTQQHNTTKKQQYNTNKQRITNNQYDIKNYQQQPLKIVYSIQYDNDKQPLQPLINNKPRYKDISIKTILKILYSTHKISKFLYKDTIKRIQQNKNINNRIKEHINLYLSTFKSNNNKNTLSTLQQTKHTRININGYSVILKKRTSERIQHLQNIEIQQEKHTFRTERIQRINELITQQFNKKLINDNKILINA